jgi:hypothetical protein
VWFWRWERVETSAEGGEGRSPVVVEWFDDDDEEVRLVGAGRGRAAEVVAVLSTSATTSCGGANSPKLAANASMTPASLSNLSSATRTRCRSCQFSFSRWRTWRSARSKYSLRGSYAHSEGRWSCSRRARGPV